MRKLLKFFVVGSAIIFCIPFLPFVIGAIVVFTIYKSNPKTKIAWGAISIVVLISLFLGSAWTSAFFNHETPQKSNSANTVQITEDSDKVKGASIETTVDTVEVTPTPTSTPTPSPTQKATVLPLRTSTPKPATPAPTPNSGLSNDNYYTNSDGNTVHSPAYSDSVPSGATAKCRDGTYSFSQHRSGTCSGHGGVYQWL